MKWFVLLGCVVASSSAFAGHGRIDDLPRPPAAAVASAHPLASDAGIEILRAGGNAFDASVAVAAALAVVEPTGSGLGGGGFWMVHRARDGFEQVIDGREVAPDAATGDMYLKRNGDSDRNLSLHGPLAAGIPGEPAALAHIARSLGRLPLARSLQPAIRLARDGFAIDAKLARRIALNLGRMSPAAQAVFAPGGVALVTGDRLVQSDLARTMERFARGGAPGFYRGRTAELLLAGVREDGGIWKSSDLARYSIVEREPIVTRWRGNRVVSPPPPSAGGVALAQLLPLLDRLDWPQASLAGNIHLVVESWRRIYRDRADYLGDPDFVDIPIARLTGREYLDRLAAQINPQRAKPSSELPRPGGHQPSEATNTTHYSVLDAEGNYVSATLSINLSFGSGYMPPGSGVLLNDEMDDFATDPMRPNAYGLVGGLANTIRPHKRMLSSMTPTFVQHPERGVLLIGTPGGSRIITMVALGILDFAAGAPARSIVAAPRYHHQYLPDRISHEPAAIDAPTRARLESMGHEVQQMNRQYGNMQVVHWDVVGGTVHAASDPRGVGAVRIVPGSELDPARHASDE